MTPKEARDLSAPELETKLRDTRDQLLHLRLRKHTGQIEKPHQIREYRKDIARLETVRRANQKPA